MSPFGETSRRLGVVLIVMLAGLGLALAQQVQTDYDRSADFSKFKSYRWVRIEGAKYPDQLADKDIIQSIDEQLQAAGLRKVESDPADLLVGYQLSLEEEKEIVAYGGLGWRVGGGMATATTSTYEVGTLVVDLYDPATKSLIWRGSATETLASSSDPDKRMKRLRKIMGKVFKSYPPDSKKS